ncbi:DMT family transporter [Bacillus sp. FSL M8-0266]|uniref:DMT family transporter n=1 Tax=Bacillus TaxID=1386 RepID=UPI0007EEC711|nr:DMT family transporter [Bacillus pumilus]MBB6602800.1 EamA family transporter [Bacillus pumilus]MBU8573019.1 DMT family transporter [Bacillus pumilus]MCY7538370.1 DMT family transporter [Bacillus pumilus]MCY7576879.1 DMT family transporter [Bacillus pumilus]MEC3592566.1 DMT family transporter [Bacillus pumilus]
MDRNKGILLVLIGAICWGVGGTVSQKLFQQYGIYVNWLVTVRLLISGGLLLFVHFMTKERAQLIGVWQKKRTAMQVLIFGVMGMLAVQYTYMASIQLGNAAVATLLQYTAPVMIIMYLVLRRQSTFTKRDMLTVSLAFMGMFLLLTNGSVSTLTVPFVAVVWGILSAVALSFYTLYPINLLKEFDSLVVVGWAMLIGGAVLSLVHPPWKINLSHLPVEAYVYLLFVIIFGTMIAFWFYIESLQYLSPKESSLIGSVEPLAAVVTTVFWLKEPFGFFQWAGTACIVYMILFMALYQPKK